jgi:hypothetical protein
MHRALGRAIRAGKGKLTPESSGTIDISFEDLRTRPETVRESLRPPQGLAADALVTVDLSASPYDLVGERLLFHLAVELLELVKGSRRTLVLILPGTPPRASLLWTTLRELPADGGARIVVVDPTGTITVRGGGRRIDVDRQLRARAREIQGSLVSDVKARMDAKLLKRLGHFRVLRPNGEEFCARYFYDLSSAEAEVATLLEHRLRRAYKSAELKRATLVLFGASSHWMRKVGSMLEIRLGCKYVAIDRGASGSRPRLLSDTCNILLFDTVSTGEVRDAALAALRRWKRPVGSIGFTALTTDPSALDADEDVSIHALASVPQHTVPSGACEQCLAQIPHDASELEERFVAISAHDMWSMMLDVKWAPEPYGAKRKELYDFIPDFGALFETYGAWIAYKYRQLLEHLGYTGDVVMVHPDEERAARLMRSLQRSLEQRLVAVAIPRDDLKLVAERKKTPHKVFEQASAAAASGAAVKDWQRQLLQLRTLEGVTHVVGIDEFNASGRSARALIDVLHAFGIEVAAYLPFLDRHPLAPLPGVPTYALYEIVSPRVA